MPRTYWSPLYICLIVQVILLTSPAYAVKAISTVRVVFMNHLDVGYNGISPEIGFISNVINRYFDVYWERAYETAMLVAQSNLSDCGFTYTTHPFLVSLYLDCPPGLGLHCPNETAIQRFKSAVANNWIAWHAAPFNAEPELYDPQTFSDSLSLARDLDVLFNRSGTPAAARTMSQRDVPGLTRAVIPLLVQNNVHAISVGSNPYSAPAAVPDVFVWRDPASNSQILTLYHKGGYGGVALNDCVVIPDFDTAFCMAFNTDNAGPQNFTEVQNIISTIQNEFGSGVAVRASTFDEYIDLLQPYVSKLPVIEQEMGDTWIYGISSDPFKIAAWRSILRHRSACVQSSFCNSTEYAFKNFTRLLVKGAEHTWGLTGHTLSAFADISYSNKQFDLLRPLTPFQQLQESWVEQRNYIMQYAFEALSAGSYACQQLLASIQQELAELSAVTAPNLEGFVRVNNLAQIFHIGQYQIGFDAETGAISTLSNTATNMTWASASSPLALVQYQTYDSVAFTSYQSQYAYCCGSSFASDFGKPLLEFANPTQQLVSASLVALWMQTDDRNNVTQFQLQLSLNESLHTQYGAPQSIWLSVSIPYGESDSDISLELRLLNKTTTRMPEAMWLRFDSPSADHNTSVWQMDKLGQWISPSEVMNNGSQHLHAVYTGIRLLVNDDDAQHQLQIFSADCALVNAGEPYALPVPLDAVPDMSQGMSFGLLNNLWSTNYILWYPYLPQDANSMFRFRLSTA